MRVLNLYAGIGGNRTHWQNVNVTAVEWDPKRAAVYAARFPGDKVVIADAHEYLLKHWREFDLIWSSPPCPTHGQMRFRTRVIPGRSEAVYPDMQLWQEILFLEKHTEITGANYVVENVETYYDPLRPPQHHARHYFWASFHISRPPKNPVDVANMTTIGELQMALGVNLDVYDLPDKRLVLRNCVHPLLGKHIFDCALRNMENTKREQLSLM